MKAFPLQASENSHGWNAAQSGMDLRDYIAVKAMQSLFDSKIIMEICERETDGELPELIAAMSYNMADEMMKARTNETN